MSIPFAKISEVQVQQTKQLYMKIVGHTTNSNEIPTVIKVSNHQIATVSNHQSFKSSNPYSFKSLLKQNCSIVVTEMRPSCPRF